jgi:hypothetical protein
MCGGSLGKDGWPALECVFVVLRYVDHILYAPQCSFCLSVGPFSDLGLVFYHGIIPCVAGAPDLEALNFETKTFKVSSAPAVRLGALNHFGDWPGALRVLPCFDERSLFWRTADSWQSRHDTGEVHQRGQIAENARHRIRPLWRQHPGEIGMAI